MDIVEFLRARLDEDEAVARAAIFVETGDSKWSRRPRPSDDPVFDAEYPRFDITVRDKHFQPDGHALLASDLDPEVSAHVLRHDPARVLREVEAKQRIVDLHSPKWFRREWPTKRPDVQLCPACYWQPPYPCETLRLLALPYADHPDYQPEWKP